MLPALLFLAAAQFEAQTVATDLPGGYQVVAADMNHDGKPDLIALASGMRELVWYENPTWKRHVLATGLSRMINCVVIGSEVVVAHGFENDASKSPGFVSVIHADGTIQEIDRIPTAHRLRLATIDGQQVVVNAPLTGPAARPPNYDDHVPLVFYRPGTWKRETIDNTNAGVQHGIFVDGRSIWTASFSGIIRYDRKGRTWRRVIFSKGDPRPCPNCGTSDIAVARKGWLAAIEPWHGNQIVVYNKGRREVIDDALTDAHSIATADFEGDGQESILVAQRGSPGRVLLYKKKQRTILDQNITAASCIPVDLDGDHRPDIACIGQSSHNLKIYWNRPN